MVTLALALAVLSGSQGMDPALERHRQGGSMRAGPNPDWATSSSLADVDLSGFVPSDREGVLDYARSECCDCGCGMTIAECHSLMSWCQGAARQVATAVEEVSLGAVPEHVRHAVEAVLPRRRFADLGVGRLGSRVDDPGTAMAVIGPPDAPVELLMFGDFRDVLNGEMARLAPAAAEGFPREVQLAFKCLPSNADPRAWLAAEAARAASAQGKLAELAEKMESNRDRISREQVMVWASEVGMDVGRLAEELDRRTHLDAVERDVADARRIGLLRAPVLLVSGRPYSGRPALPDLRALIRAELRAGAPSTRIGDPARAADNGGGRP